MSTLKARTQARASALMRKTALHARDIITDPNHWVVGYRAVRRVLSVNFLCSPFSKRAVAFCHNGALLRAGYELTGSKRKAWELARGIIRFEKENLTGGMRPQTLNDGADGHFMALHMLDRAAARIR